MKTCNKGFSLIEAVVALAIMGIGIKVVLSSNEIIMNGLAVQIDVEKRAELLNHLQFLNEVVDCRTVRSLSPGPVELLARNSGRVLVATNGSLSGSFHYLAEKTSDGAVKLLAAAFKEPDKIMNAREKLSAAADEFLKHKSQKKMWSWDNTSEYLSKNMPNMNSICSLELVVSCPPGSFLVGLDNRTPECRSAAGNTVVYNNTSLAAPATTTPPQANLGTSTPLSCGKGTFGSKLTNKNGQCGKACAKKLASAADQISVVSLETPSVKAMKKKQNKKIDKTVFNDIQVSGILQGCNPLEGVNW